MPKIAEEERFWMVVRKNAVPNSAPKVRHRNYGWARKEAQRLADLTGERFVVLCAVSEAVPEAAAEEPAA